MCSRRPTLLPAPLILDRIARQDGTCPDPVACRTSSWLAADRATACAEPVARSPAPPPVSPPVGAARRSRNDVHPRNPARSELFFFNRIHTAARRSPVTEFSARRLWARWPGRPAGPGSALCRDASSRVRYSRRWRTLLHSIRTFWANSGFAVPCLSFSLPPPLGPAGAARVARMRMCTWCACAGPILQSLSRSSLHAAARPGLRRATRPLASRRAACAARAGFAAVMDCAHHCFGKVCCLLLVRADYIGRAAQRARGIAQALTGSLNS